MKKLSWVILIFFIALTVSCITHNHNAPKGVQKDGSGNTQVIDSPGAGAK